MLEGCGRYPLIVFAHGHCIGDPEHFRKDLEDALAVTAADVHRVAKQYLTKGRVVLSMVPAGQTNLAAKPNLPFVNVTPKPAVQ